MDTLANFFVKDKWNRDFGVLSYSRINDVFYFKYAEDTKGVEFSDININLGKVFIKKTIFSLFELDDSFIKNKFVSDNNLQDKSENEIQVSILKALAEKNELSPKGFYYEEL